MLTLNQIHYIRKFNKQAAKQLLLHKYAKNVMLSGVEALQAGKRSVKHYVDTATGLLTSKDILLKKLSPEFRVALHDSLMNKDLKKGRNDFINLMYSRKLGGQAFRDLLKEQGGYRNKQYYRYGVSGDKSLKEFYAPDTELWNNLRSLYKPDKMQGVVMKDRLHLATKQNKTLETELARHLHDKQVLEKQYADTQSRVGELEQALKNKTITQKEYEDQYRSLAHDLDNLKQEHTALTESHNALISNHNNTRLENVDLNKKLNNVQADKSRLLTDKKSLTHSNKMLTATTAGLGVAGLPVAYTLGAQDRGNDTYTRSPSLRAKKQAALLNLYLRNYNIY